MKFSDEWQDFKNNHESDQYQTFRNNIVNEYFEIYGYQEFVNKYKYLKNKKTKIYDKSQINNLFSDIVLIIDEVHNFR